MRRFRAAALRTKCEFAAKAPRTASGQLARSGDGISYFRRGRLLYHAEGAICSGEIISNSDYKIVKRALDYFNRVADSEVMT